MKTNKQQSKLVLPNKKTTKTTELIGSVLSVLSLLTLFPLFYGVFFERESYFNRLALYKWMLNNTLPKPETIKEYTIWEVDGLEIILSWEKWYAFHDNDLVICSFCSDIFDLYRYKKIKKMLEASKRIYEPSPWAKSYHAWLMKQTCVDCGEKYSERGDKLCATEIQCGECFSKYGNTEKRGLPSALEKFESSC